MGLFEHWQHFVMYLPLQLILHFENQFKIWIKTKLITPFLPYTTAA